MPVAKKQKRRGKAPDKRPCHARYNAERRDLLNKNRKTLKNTHGRLTYADMLVVCKKGSRSKA